MDRDNRHRGYLMQFACFDCRKAFKQPAAFPKRIPEERHICPQCGAEMVEMGRNFRAPKRDDLEQWKKVEALVRAGFSFHSVNSYRTGRYPERLSEVDSFVEKAREKLGRVSSGEELLRKIDDKGSE